MCKRHIDNWFCRWLGAIASGTSVLTVLPGRMRHVCFAKMLARIHILLLGAGTIFSTYAAFGRPYFKAQMSDDVTICKWCFVALNTHSVDSKVVV
jgi:hypothetical protein